MKSLPISECLLQLVLDKASWWAFLQFNKMLVAHGEQPPTISVLNMQDMKRIIAILTALPITFAECMNLRFRILFPTHIENNTSLLVEWLVAIFLLEIEK